MRKIIKLTESDLTRIVRRVIREEEEDDDDDGGYYTFDFGGPKDSTALISDIVELIENSEDVNDFKMKIKQYTKNNQEDFNKLSDDERDDIDRFINSIITRHDFPSLLNIEEG
jgi:geranylgeranyl pyrophosphate synthase